MLMLVKFGSDRGISTPEIMFWRQAIPAAAMFAFFALTGRIGAIRTRRLGNHISRALIGMIGMANMFVSVSLLPLAASSTLTFTAPLFAVLLTAFVLRNHVGIWRWGAVLLGFAGVLVIVQPGGNTLSPIGIAAGLTAGLVVAIVNFQIRDLAKTESPACIVFYFSLFGAMVAGLVVPFFMTAHSLADWLLLTATGLAGGASQWFISASLRHGSVLAVIIVDYMLLLWATLYGWAIWQTLPGWTLLVGAPAIIAAGIIITWREHSLARQLAGQSSAAAH